MSVASACMGGRSGAVGAVVRAPSARAVAVELGALVGVVGALAWVAIAMSPASPQLYLLFAPSLWAAQRRALDGAVAGVAVTGAAVVVAAANVGGELSESRLQVFIVVHAVSAYVLGVAQSLRSAALAEAREAAERLELERDLAGLAERQFRLSLEAAPIGVALVGPDGRFLEVNDALCAIVGYGRAELLERTFQDITHPGDLAADLAYVDDVLAGRRQRYRMDKRYLHRLGHEVVVQLDVSLVRDEQGRALHFIAQVQDVTDQRRAAESLRVSEATQRASLEALEQGVTLSDLDGRVHLMNRAAERILGMDADELSARFASGRWETFSEDGTVLPPEDRPLGITMRTGRATRDRIVRWRRRSGELIALRVATEPIHDDDGSLRAVVTAFADVTAELAADQAQRAANERLRWHADHDPLTALLNRRALLDELDRRGRPSISSRTALLFIDLDHFKDVNDTHGHAAGDAVLVAVAERLQAVVRPDDVVARLGGDEFVVLARGLLDLDQASALADRTVAALTEPIQVGSRSLTVSASIGVTLCRPDLTPEELLDDADAGLYAAKLNGRGRHAVTS